MILKPPDFKAATVGVILFNVSDCPNAPNPDNVTQIEKRDYLALKFSSANLPVAIDFAPRSIYFFESAKELTVDFFSAKNYKDGNGDLEPFRTFKQNARDCENIPISPNPDPKSISLTPRFPGIFLYTKAYDLLNPAYPWQGKSISYQISQSRLPPDFYNRIMAIRPKQPSDPNKLHFGAVLHAGENFKGKAEVFMRSWPNLKYSNHNQVPLMPAGHNIERIGNINITSSVPSGLDVRSTPSSITVFKQNPDVNSANTITLCRNPNCNEEGGDDANLILDFDDFRAISPPYTFYGPRPPPTGFPRSDTQSNIIRGIPNIKTSVSHLKWSNEDDINYGYSLITPEGVSAINFDAENYILLLFKEADYKGDALILRKSEMVLDVVDFNDKVASIIIIKGQ